MAGAGSKAKKDEKKKKKKKKRVKRREAVTLRLAKKILKRTRTKIWKQRSIFRMILGSPGASNKRNLQFQMVSQMARTKRHGRQ